LGRNIVENGYLGAPPEQDFGPYYEWRGKNPPPMGAIPEIRQKTMDPWDAAKPYYGVVKWGAPSSFFEPLYPMLSAAMYWLFGDRLLFHRLMLAVMSSATCFFVFGIGRRLFNETTGYIAALICACYPYFIFYTVILMSETILIFFLAVSVYYFVRLRDEPSLIFAMLFGIALGLTFLTRSIVLGLIPVFILLLWLEGLKSRFVLSILALAAFVMTISPWIIRNYNLHGQFVLLSTRGGYNIWLRNNPFYYADELKALGYRVPQELLDNIKYREFLDYPQFPPETGEVERNKVITQEGIKYIKANPKLFAYLCWIRLRTLIGVKGTLAQGMIYNIVGYLSFGIIFPLALIAFFLQWKKWRDTVPLLLIFLYFIGVYTLTHDGIRYRLPADPYMIILAASLLPLIYHRLFKPKKA
ncbi:MAG: glycosyltransferase family 39 protein, partial [FCB group bacterium]|nr:glycosyltransferase family 39 protein [FCB group bacterium]